MVGRLPAGGFQGWRLYGPKDSGRKHREGSPMDRQGGACLPVGRPGRRFVERMPRPFEARLVSTGGAATHRAAKGTYHCERAEARLVSGAVATHGATQIFTAIRAEPQPGHEREGVPASGHGSMTADWHGGESSRVRGKAR
jgi:hypothetical protein